MDQQIQQSIERAQEAWGSQQAVLVDPAWLQSTPQPEQPMQRAEVPPTPESITVLANVSVPQDSMEMPVATATTTTATSCASLLPPEYDREDSEHDEE